MGRDDNPPFPTTATQCIHPMYPPSEACFEAGWPGKQMENFLYAFRDAIHKVTHLPSMAHHPPSLYGSSLTFLLWLITHTFLV